MRKSIMDELLEALMPEFVQTVSAPQPPEAGDGETELVREGSPAVPVTADVQEKPAGEPVKPAEETEKRRTVKNLRDLVIYSEIMKPKYDS